MKQTCQKDEGEQYEDLHVRTEMKNKMSFLMPSLLHALDIEELEMYLIRQPAAEC